VAAMSRGKNQFQQEMGKDGVVCLREKDHSKQKVGVVTRGGGKKNLEGGGGAHRDLTKADGPFRATQTVGITPKGGHLEKTMPKRKKGLQI